MIQLVVVGFLGKSTELDFAIYIAHIAFLRYYEDIYTSKIPC